MCDLLLAGSYSNVKASRTCGYIKLVCAKLFVRGICSDQKLGSGQVLLFRVCQLALDTGKVTHLGGGGGIEEERGVDQKHVFCTELGNVIERER